MCYTSRDYRRGEQARKERQEELRRRQREEEAHQARKESPDKDRVLVKG